MAVELNVRSQLSKVSEELAKLQVQASKVGEELAKVGDTTGETLEDQAKKTGRFFENLRGLGGRVAKQLRDDFKSLLALNAVSQSLKLSQQFSGTVTEAVALSDTIRKLGSTLGITQSRFTTFQTKLVSGLGQIGLSSEAASNALAGLAETPVRGEENLQKYVETAGQLASISRQQGSEGAIAKGLAGVVTAQGGNPNDQKQLDAVAKDALRIRQATGKSITDVLGSLEQLFSSANADFKSKLKNGGGTSLAAASLIGGKDSTAFVERYLRANRIGRKGLEAQGIGKLIGDDGQLNPKAFQDTVNEGKRRGLGDAQAGLKTFGMSEEEAQGFIRLTEAMRTNGASIEQARKSIVDINKTYQESKGFAESFRASLNRVKGFLSAPLSFATQKGTDLLNSASQSDAGSAGVVAGGGALAALLAGGGLRGLGKASGIAKGAAIEATTGRQVQPVYVVNAREFGGGGAGAFGETAAASAGGIRGKAGKALGALGIAATAFEVGSIAGDAIDKTETGGKAFDALADAILNLTEKIGLMKSTPVIVEINSKVPNLRATTPQSRGATNGPGR